MIRGRASPWETSCSATRSVARLVALGDRVRERPDRLLGGVGDHRVQVLSADGAALARPEREPLELGAEPHWPRAHTLDEHPRGVELEGEAHLARVGDQALRHLALLRRLEGEHLSPRRLHRLLQGSRRLAVATRAMVVSGGIAARASATRSSVLLAPPLDAVGEQVAAGGHQRDRHRPSRSERRRREPSRPWPASNSSRAPDPPSRSARARSLARVREIFASSVPQIRYAGLISAGLEGTRPSLFPAPGEPARTLAGADLYLPHPMRRLGRLHGGSTRALAIACGRARLPGDPGVRRRARTTRPSTRPARRFRSRPAARALARLQPRPRGRDERAGPAGPRDGRHAREELLLELDPRPERPGQGVVHRGAPGVGDGWTSRSRAST